MQVASANGGVTNISFRFSDMEMTVIDASQW